MSQPIQPESNFHPTYPDLVLFPSAEKCLRGKELGLLKLQVPFTDVFVSGCFLEEDF